MFENIPRKEDLLNTPDKIAKSNAALKEMQDKMSNTEKIRERRETRRFWTIVIIALLTLIATIVQICTSK